MNRTYLCIDLKSFYASVECMELGLDPLTTNLVVADESRTEKTICPLRQEGLMLYKRIKTRFFGFESQSMCFKNSMVCFIILIFKRRSKIIHKTAVTAAMLCIVVRDGYFCFGLVTKTS